MDHPEETPSTTFQIFTPSGNDHLEDDNEEGEGFD